MSEPMMTTSPTEDENHQKQQPGGGGGKEELEVPHSITRGAIITDHKQMVFESSTGPLLDSSIATEQQPVVATGSNSLLAAAAEAHSPVGTMKHPMIEEEVVKVNTATIDSTPPQDTEQQESAVEAAAVTTAVDSSDSLTAFNMSAAVSAEKEGLEEEEIKDVKVDISDHHLLVVSELEQRLANLTRSIQTENRLVESLDASNRGKRGS